MPLIIVALRTHLSSTTMGREYVEKHEIVMN